MLKYAFQKLVWPKVSCRRGVCSALRILPITQGGTKKIQPNSVTFLKIYRILFKSKSLSMDPVLRPWQHFLGVGRVLRKNRVFQNSIDVTVTSFLNQPQHNFVILLEILPLYQI